MPATTSIGNGTTVLDIPLNQISEAPDNVRTEYDQAELEELAESIMQHGLLQPLTVYGGPEAGGDGTYAVYMGHRRWRALQWLRSEKRIKAGEPIRCVVDNDSHHGGEINGTGTARMLIENLQRVDISALDEARGYQRMTEQFGYTQRDLAATVGKSSGHIAKRLALLTLPDDVQACIGTTLEIDQAYRLSRLDENDIKRLAKNIVGGGRGAQLNYDLDQAERQMERRKKADKFAKALAKIMVEPISDHDIEDRNRLEFLDSYDIDSLGEYEPKKNHVVAWGLGVAKDSIRVYRKLTAKQIEARDAKRLEEQAAYEAEVEAEEAEWLENEATPHERWQHEVDKIEEQYDLAVEEWAERATTEIGTVVKDTDTKALHQIVLGMAVGTTLTHSQAERACEALSVPVPETDDDGNELMRWHRPFREALDAWIDGDSNRKLQAYIVSNAPPAAVVSSPVFKSIAAAVEANGLVKPTLPELPPEPWFDPVDGEWVTTDDRRLDDGTTEPVRDDFDTDEEYDAALDNFNAAFDAEQKEYASTAS